MLAINETEWTLEKIYSSSNCLKITLTAKIKTVKANKDAL